MNGLILRLAAIAVLSAAPGIAWTRPIPAWAAFAPAQPVTILGYADDAMEPFLSRDGATLFFNNRNDPPEKTDLHWAERIDDLTFRYRGKVEGANSADLDGVPTLARNGRLCFVSTRSYRLTLATVYCGVWKNSAISDLALQADASVHRLGRLVFDVELNAAGDQLVLADGAFTGGPVPASADLRLARLGPEGFRLTPADDGLFAAVNTRALEYAAAMSSDDLLLAFTRLEGRPPHVRFSTWIAHREQANQPFGSPIRITAIAGDAEAPTFSPDDHALYFHRREGARYTIWRIAR